MEPLPEWHELVKELDSAEVMEEIGSHFLPYFLYRWLPKITVAFDDGTPENITRHFQSHFIQFDSGEFTCEIEDKHEILNYSLTRIRKSNRFTNHCLLFAAADRIVGHPRDLTTKLGGAHFTNALDEKYVVIAVVRGEAFESRLNDARTSINISPKAIEAIVSTVCDAIQRKETGQIAKIKADQSANLTDAARESNSPLRPKRKTY